MGAEVHYLESEFHDRLKSDNQLFEWIEKGALAGISYRDLENHGNQWLSPRLKQLFGYAADEIPSTATLLQDSIFPEDLPVAPENFHNEPYDQVLRYRHKTGKTIWVRCRGLIIRNPCGTPIRMVGVHTDITEEKLREIELERSNQDLSTFAYVASHDLKSPLRAIKQLATWIEEDLDSDRDGVIENIDIMKRRILRMETLLHDLLAYSRIGRLEKKTESVDTLTSIRSIFEILDIPTGFNMTTEGEFPTLITLKAPFEQVIRNLIGNAVKHSGNKSGKVTVSVKASDGFYEFCIKDDGPGIPERFQTKIFEMFQTLKPRDRVEGSGMGLATAKKIVETHGGSIWLSSVCNENNEASPSLGPSGTSFYFTWPQIIAK